VKTTDKLVETHCKRVETHGKRVKTYSKTSGTKNILRYLPCDFVIG